MMSTMLYRDEVEVWTGQGQAEGWNQLQYIRKEVEVLTGEE